MPTEVKVPALGESISTGILTSWSVEDGAFVNAGDTLYELETDKITTEGKAEVSGIIQLKAANGDEVEVGAIIALIEERATPSGSGGKTSPISGPEAKSEDTQATSTGSQGQPTPPQSSQEQSTAEPAKSETKHPLSPAARRAAEVTGVDPGSLKGSGKDGRVLKEDILGATAKQSSKPDIGSPASPEPDLTAPAPGEAPAHAPKANASPLASAPIPSTAQRTAEQTAQGSETRRNSTRSRMSPLRRRIAERLVQAQQSAALLTTFNECDMSGVMDLRKRHQEAFVKKHGCKLGFMSFFVKACVQALKEVPMVNATIEGDEIVENHFYDIGVAMSTARGLLVPVIRQAESKGFARIEQDILDYAAKAKEGRISIEDLSGGVFTITNGGIFGSMLSTPIVNFPQSAILGMHAIQERPVAREGSVVIRPMMYLALTYDHRLIDGREAVTFLVKVKEAIEDPSRLLFDV